MKIPDDYPIGCSEEEIETVVHHFQDKISKVYNTSTGGGTNYFAQVTEQGNSELNRRISKKLIANLEISSKRQRELTWAIIIIGGLNLLIVFFKLF